ncbi:A disintegrin and metalloproteinase with thrombospondin motifs 9-like [Crassostrea angulata]|uniref:A disintegrin and metalloproteinase with thrombospondin motifs 9-like n=1 Tax=Magallana angulata TaxID=2784310 RepID=UPI0022B09BE1|nr:A disintegrin and metalloproteinase with thrombospondin motifs 9-like [Crassostrea angulata]
MKMILNIHRLITVLFWCLLILPTSLGKSDEIFLRRTTTRIDLLEPSMAIWSGYFSHRSKCASKCTQEPDCVSLLYNMADESCHLFNVIYDSDDSGEVDNYWVLENRGSRWAPESCLALSTCSGIATDGEYWVYPIVTNRRRTKIYCHSLVTEPSHFITLKYPNSFVGHGSSNWITRAQCRSEFKPPLRQTNFTKVKIQIESMVVNGTDYTFTSLTGSKQMQYGYASDCNGEHFRNPCPHFGTATIDTRGTGLIVDPTVEFGAFPYPKSFEGATKDFNRSALGDQISFTCAGWCGSCGPISGPIRFQHSTDFISAADAQAIICHK